MAKPPRIALVHDWLVTMRGGERVLEVFCELFPEAPLFTLVHRPGELSPPIERMDIRTSFIQHAPLGRSRYQYYLPLFPAAARGLDLRDFDLILSSSSAAAKGVRPRPGAIHICYCHTPMRYIWDQYDEYFGPGRASWIVRLAARATLPRLRRWDLQSAAGVTWFIANSENVRERIRRIYKREAVVIYPPVDVDRFTISRRDDGYYLVVSALVPYKRVDLAVEAFNRRGDRLVVVGSGPEENKLRKLAQRNIEFHGRCTDDAVRRLMEGCRALVFPGQEDFGIVPVEAMACGKPVIAFGRGGALETVEDGRTGILFDEQHPEALAAAVARLSTLRFDPKEIRLHAEKFRRERFTEEIRRYLGRCLDARAQA